MRCAVNKNTFFGIPAPFIQSGERTQDSTGSSCLLLRLINTAARSCGDVEKVWGLLSAKQTGS